MARDIVLAGVPRGGTTLACVLLNQVPNTVALNEPFPMGGLVSQPNAHSQVEWLKNRFAETRDSLQKTGSAFCKAKDGPLFRGYQSNLGEHPRRALRRHDENERRRTFCNCSRGPTAETAIEECQHESRLRESQVNRFPRHLLENASSWASFYSAGDIESLANALLSKPRVIP